MTTWQISVRDADDPHHHCGVATQVRENFWEVHYFRGDEEISDGHIITPPPYLPPFATMRMTLLEERRAGEYRQAAQPKVT